MALACSMVAACTPAPHHHLAAARPTAPATTDAPDPTTAAPTTTLGSTTTSTAAHTGPAVVPRPYAVGTVSLDLTDPSRTTSGRPGRHLPAIVFYPAPGRAGPAELGGVPAAHGTWPLVLFAHGYNVNPLTYHDLLHHLAEAGFVVAAPSFPLGTLGGPLDESDLDNQPGDLSFVLTRVLAASATGTGPLGATVDPKRVGVVGHSDGAEAALGMAFLPGTSDTRVGPVVSMAGQAILNGDQVVSAPVTHPLLVVQGTEDTINPPSRSEHLYATAPQPRAYLSLLGGGHLPPVADPTPWRPIVEAVVVDWLDQAFGGINAGGAASRLVHDANVAGVARLTLG